MVPGEDKEDLFAVVQTDMQKATSSKTWAMNYSVFSSENKFDFNKAKQELIQRQEDFDFFFLSILTCASADFLINAQVEDPSLQENYPTEPGAGRISIHKVYSSR